MSIFIRFQKLLSTLNGHQFKNQPNQNPNSTFAMNNGHNNSQFGQQRNELTYLSFSPIRNVTQLGNC
ncbi:hypothetical protein DDB_G0268312 [Dictyostelium discoideum AX4]|uniref:Uncharacterized protein n=1 Tax=Dictyostelium discoideum TaxID=44689 RepID=Q55GG0_DICDI|nr:hypothetical protein DDB_G0268312 [Dictyostelium discoideum AX4]EAL73609.1 hypothetical protein DDB_G0268312 [Dictyostelium discoideum AX4]|eukprot:XP_647224.1 hypothetical protein DDB_G0268312 [Dictyostelium discoideum AX4]